ncbi:uncharacterized protein LOC133178271 [Saccostrea echinata]|uniref:uncharacterized protein LOC133178271 n=1 Tax=Saccostrea echinata TaxID=191078 RepID=UPI002A803A8D|nr:uncharacterized protein LOC133178271 [Saccostrea echinata]
MKDLKLLFNYFHNKTFTKTVNNSPPGTEIETIGNFAYLYTAILDAPLRDFVENGTVNIVKNEKTEEVIRLQNWNPLTICTTSSGDLLVIMEREDETKLVRYSGSTEKKSIQFDDKGKPLYLPGSLFKHITENRNRDICVADNGFHAIVVVNMTGKLNFRFTGPTPSLKNNLLSPRGIIADSQSHNLTAAYCNNCVYIIDQGGQFLRYIECGLSEPWGLCTDTNNNLFVAEYTNRQVKKIKYLQ